VCFLGRGGVVAGVRGLGVGWRCDVVMRRGRRTDFGARGWLGAGGLIRQLANYLHGTVESCKDIEHYSYAFRRSFCASPRWDSSAWWPWASLAASSV
jgi:hypothetical protein